MDQVIKFFTWVFAKEERGEDAYLLRELLYHSIKTKGMLTITHIEAVDIDVERIMSLDPRFRVRVREFDYEINIYDDDIVTKIRSFGF